MTDEARRKEHAALLELMKQAQRDGSPVPPLDREAFAKLYVKVGSKRRDDEREDGR